MPGSLTWFLVCPNSLIDLKHVAFSLRASVSLSDTHPCCIAHFFVVILRVEVLFVRLLSGAIEQSISACSLKHPRRLSRLFRDGKNEEKRPAHCIAGNLGG